MLTLSFRRNEMMTMEKKWQAVQGRDAGADGKFFYAVRTTGVYCRPSCPSRRPRRESVEFFTTAHAAERAGYRACRRCRPTEISRQVRAVQAACQHIERNLDRNAPLTALARTVGMSPFHLARVFKRRLGVTPSQYRQARRLERFKSELNAQRTVTDAIFEAGYGSTSRLYENATRQLGMSPSRYRNGAGGEEISYTVFDTPLGMLALAATGKGICAIRFGESAEALAQELKSEFSRADLRRADSALAPFARAVRDHVDGALPDLDLPFDIRATAFQRRVWDALRSIPYGRTASYSEVARGIGHPRAVRAVANACANNPVALVIPCHRVVHKDGSASGYRWGKERKRKLLAMERENEQVGATRG
jgi:AraC family transcriptional regulator of adaptative response/methylated-DNA-[protein]-cysteine methyltransferase